MRYDVIHDVKMADDAVECVNCGKVFYGVPPEFLITGMVVDIGGLGQTQMPLLDPTEINPNEKACTHPTARKQAEEDPGEIELQLDPDRVRHLPTSTRSEEEKAATRAAWANWVTMRDLTRPEGVEAG